MGDLPIGERAVNPRASGAEVILAERGLDGYAGELAVGELDSVGRGRENHLAQVVGADLMAEPAGSAVDGDHDGPFLELESPGRFGAVDLVDESCTSR